ncbi:MAG: FAD-dependent oxidoreductase [Firmicutes bacterium]|nr:FAD-dependent oxidoreductase [Bacillota bacterium]
MIVKTKGDLQKTREDVRAAREAYTKHVFVCGGGGCVSTGCMDTKAAVEEYLRNTELAQTVGMTFTGCMGLCAFGPVMLVEPEGVFYVNVTPQKAKEILYHHIGHGKIMEEYTYYDQNAKRHIPLMKDIPFFSQQIKIALRNCGRIDFSSLDEYIAEGGFSALAKALTEMDRKAVVEEIKRSGLRGRGGAGFPTGIKWEAGMNAPGGQKYIACNADEGDPGAFMDRSLIESDPFGLMEGLMIGAYAIGASKGFVYVRAEYPIAVERLGHAIRLAREAGLLGEKILGTKFAFDLEVRIGAGAFVCGEETALMSSVEGKRGEPAQKPPFPFESGLYGCPTIINNVETLANVPAIIDKGADWYAALGVGKSKGTKVFALAGDIINAGIAEVPMGIPLGDLIFKIGGGIPKGKAFKAAQIGGPSGGCLTKEHLNTSVDYETLTSLGAIMGSGGLIVMGEDTCMVDTARYFLDFIQDESCGKCVPCRIGTKRMLEILERITRGEGTEEDVKSLRELSHNIGQTAMCGLGQSAPNPVLSTLQYFGREYEEHIHDHRCEAGVCSSMFISPCQNACPAGVNVPGYMALIQEGRFMDAYRLIRQDNPFPGVCGRVCTHPCERKCRRTQRDEAIAICDLKRFVADFAMNHEEKFLDDIKYAKNGKKIAIVGAGPSGLTCAYYLVRLGYDVDVFESHSQAGGVLAYGIPEYRLPTDILEHEIQLIKQEGVNIHLNTEVGRDISFALLREEYDAIYLATGTQFPNLVGVEGEGLKGVYHGLPFLKDIHFGKRMKVGKRVAVIGGGSTAIDAARSAIRLGAQKVVVVYRRNIDDMPADRREIDEALEEGVQIMELTAPVRFLGDEKGRVTGMECVKMGLGEYDGNGRRKPRAVKGSEFVIETDMIIPAVSQHADFPFISKDDVELTEWGTMVTKKHNLMTSIEGVFAGGDLARGSDTAITAIADGKKAASSIDMYLGGSGKLNVGKPIDIPPAYVDEDSAEYNRFPQEMLPPEKRVEGFREVSLGYRKLNAVAEATRCLRCDKK